MPAWGKLAIPFRSLHREAAAPEKPRSFPTSGFKTIDQDVKVEEEEIPDYVAERFYPVRLGEVIRDQYQTVVKLGFGSSSTIWLARDLKYVYITLLNRRASDRNYLRNHRYVSLKFYVHTSRFQRELGLYIEMTKLLAKTANPGRNNIRHLLDSFEIDGPCGKHVVLAFEPAQMSLRDMKLVFQKDGGFDEMFVRGAMKMGRCTMLRTLPNSSLR
ncbi:Serine/threonine-protein kinase SRPK [Beauveria bassiana D1-5]|uniref:non-specific serine/threonine protein kinase n=1 Tax=Beauveria bassiana D1-5 TaxID=1245745 RepID=A0A0A2V922_BEABA|nr:Serine/threonine-protein kinase SRPK [Beauveria bassiana D1-5]